MDLDVVTIPSIASKPSQWVSNFTVEDEKVLLSGWLSDILANAGQQLIQQVLNAGVALGCNIHHWVSSH